MTDVDRTFSLSRNFAQSFVFKMKADETILRGVTTFADLSYHFVISCKAGKMSILLKDRMSKRQW